MENKKESSPVERNSRRVLTGIVTSTSMDKTITILVTTYKNHPIYKKRVVTSKKFLAHDEKETANLGDKVEIVETRPLSARKRFRLLKILEKAK